MQIIPFRMPMPALAAALLLAGCDYERPGTWHATGVNNANLAAMLAEPSHATRGVAAQGERAQPGTVAVRRLERGRRAVLPDTRAAAGVGFGVSVQPAQPSGGGDGQ